MSSLHEDAAGLFALETDKISKHFGAVRAVDQLSLSIPPGGSDQHRGAQWVREIYPR